MFESTYTWWKGDFCSTRKIIMESSPSISKFTFDGIILASGWNQITLGACSCQVTMGFMNMIENIAHVRGKFACKTFVDHNIQVIGVTIMKLLPAKGVKQ